MDGSDFELEDESEVEIDDSRPLELCTVDEAVEKIGFGFFQIITLSFSGLIWVRLCTLTFTNSPPPRFPPQSCHLWSCAVRHPTWPSEIVQVFSSSYRRMGEV